MGQNEIPTNRMIEIISEISANLAIVASEVELKRLADSDARAWLDDVKISALEPDQPITASQLSGAEVVIVEVDPHAPSSMERIDRIKALNPGAAIVVAMHTADLQIVRRLLRAGVDDVVALPFSSDEILQATATIVEVRSRESGSSVQLAPLISLVRALGGSGGTTAITHLGAELAKGHDRQVCIIDLDIQFGRVAEVLDLSPRRTISDLLDASDRLDAAFLKSVVAEHASGMAVIAAPNELAPVEAIDISALNRVIRIARQEYDYVLVDLPSDLTNWALSVISDSDRLLLLTEQRIPSLRQARRRIDLFRSLDMDLKALSVVLNRVEKGLFKTIGIADVEEALGCRVSNTLRADEPHVETAQQQGLLVHQVRRKSVFAQDIADLAEALKAGLGSETAL